MAETGRVFFWVQHLLGIGHLMRAAHIARHLAACGWPVDLVSGGAPVPGLDLGRARFHQLPPVRAANAEFTHLVDSEGRPLDEAFERKRRAHLLGLFEEAAPDILILEHYPFGRTQLRFELEPLLAAAAPRRPLILSSVRDVLVQRRAAREADAVAAVEQHFDAVLVHGDPALIPLEASFGGARRIAGKLAYTGYVGSGVSGAAPPPGEGVDEVIVSAGGGAVGSRIAEVAVDAARLLPQPRRWRVLLGPNAGPDILEKLRARAPSWVTVEPARPDFRGLLRRSALSVSQAGYNTVVDVLAAGARTVLIPFATARETEQTLRAERLARAGLAQVLPETSLEAARLAKAVGEALGLPRPAGTVNLKGEAETARLLSRALAGRRGNEA